MQQSSARTGDPQFVLSWLGGGVHLQGQRSVARAGDRRRVKARERAGGQAADAEIHRPGETLQGHNAEGKGSCSTAMRASDSGSTAARLSRPSQSEVIVFSSASGDSGMGSGYLVTRSQRSSIWESVRVSATRT